MGVQAANIWSDLGYAVDGRKARGGGGYAGGGGGCDYQSQRAGGAGGSAAGDVGGAGCNVAGCVSEPDGGATFLGFLRYQSDIEYGDLETQAPLEPVTIVVTAESTHPGPEPSDTVVLRRKLE